MYDDDGSSRRGGRWLRLVKPHSVGQPTPPPWNPSSSSPCPPDVFSMYLSLMLSLFIPSTIHISYSLPLHNIYIYPYFSLRLVLYFSQRFDHRGHKLLCSAWLQYYFDSLEQKCDLEVALKRSNDQKRMKKKKKTFFSSLQQLIF